MLNHTLAQSVFLGSLGLFALSTGQSMATTTPTSWDVASEFTDATNGTSGVWSYCEEATLNASCTLLPVVTNPYSGNILGWTNAAGYPIVEHNVNQTSYVATGAGGPVTFAPHGMMMHPGANCEYAVARFTAPYTGKYKISGQFFGLDDNGSETTADVHISVNSALHFNGSVNLNNATTHFSSFTVQNGITLAAGNTVDFQVGCGGDGYGYDSTGLNAIVEFYKAKKR
ncbi:MAG TPA: hypothetical protein VGF97_17065 [Rhizomicrobium sp.]|jgi:hypothetical protein